MVIAADSMPDFTGHILDNQFELLQMLGSGTYGVVYKALDTRSSSSSPSYRAIKIIRKAGRTPQEIATIRREVALHSRVSHHPSVVTLIDAYDDNDYFYIILDFCPGGDLFEKICDQRAYEGNDELLRSAFISLLDALQACHDARIAHRDLKPENILTSEDGSSIYLADFGLATNQRLIEEFGCGTSIYMSPECVGKTYGYKPYCARTSDVWALGIILINMITGRNPWQKPCPDDMGFRLFLEDPDFLMDTLPISEGAHIILRRILTLNPLRRISLPALRRAVLALDTFFRPVDDEPELQLETDDSESESELEFELVRPQKSAVWDGSDQSTPVAKARSTMAPEIDIPATPAHTRRSSSVDCSAGFACDHIPHPTTITTPSTSCSDSSSRASSSGDSDAGSSYVITPEGTTARMPLSEEIEKDIVDIDWRKGSTAQLLIDRYRMMNNGFV